MQIINIATVLTISTDVVYMLSILIMISHASCAFVSACCMDFTNPNHSVIAKEMKIQWRLFRWELQFALLEGYIVFFHNDLEEYSFQAKDALFFYVRYILSILLRILCAMKVHISITQVTQGGKKNIFLVSIVHENLHHSALICSSLICIHWTVSGPPSSGSCRHGKYT